MTEATPIQSKTEAACEALEALARQAGPGGKLPTVRVLCKSLGVSRVTLDRAMERLARQGVIVRKHGQGIFSTPARVRTVGVVFGLDPFRVAASPLYQLLFSAIRRELANRACELEIYVDLATQNDHGAVRRRLQADIMAGRVQGLLLLVSGREQSKWLRRQGITFVNYGNPLMGGWRVEFDKRQIIDLLATALARRGCRRIGLLSHPLSSQRAKDIGGIELGFFKESLQRNGLSAEPDFIFQPVMQEAEFPNPRGPNHEEIGFMLGRQLVKNRQRLPDGLLITDDMMARGALTALAREHVRIGQDLQVGVFTTGGSSALLGYEPHLIRVEGDPEGVAGGMIDMLEALMDGRRPRRQALRISPTRVLNGSSAAFRKEATGESR